MDDEQLAGLASQGDRDALAALTERYEAWIYTVAYKVALHEPDARDIAQNVLLKLVSSIRSYQAPGNFRAWLAVLISRAALDFLRQAGRREPLSWQAVPFEEVEDACPDPAPNPREALERLALREHMEKAMKYLTPQQRIILTLRLEEDLPAKDIAARLDRTCVSYAIDTDADYTARDIINRGTATIYKACYRGRPLGLIELGVPGRHNEQAAVPVFEREGFGNLLRPAADGRRPKPARSGQPPAPIAAIGANSPIVRAYSPAVVCG